MPTAKPTTPAFPQPGGEYSAEDEAQFRRAVERYLTELAAVVSDVAGIPEHASTHESGGTDEVDHGSLIGLGDDDHTQYALVDASRAFTGRVQDSQTNAVYAYVQLGAASQAIATNTTTRVDFDSEVADDGSNFDNATNFDYTVPVDGVYLIVVQINWQGNATGSRQASITINGSRAAMERLSSVGSVSTIQNVSMLVELSANDLVTAEVRQTSGGNLNVLNNTVDGRRHSFMQISLVPMVADA